MQAKLTQLLINRLTNDLQKLNRRSAERAARREARQAARRRKREIPLAHAQETFTQIFIVEAFFARELIKVLTYGANEEMHFLTGPKIGPIRIVSRWAQPVAIERQSPVCVGASAKSVASALIPLWEQGAELHVTAHSHPGSGSGASHPSPTDIACLGKLQKAGSQAIGLIVTRDKYLRFFSIKTNFHVMILGSGVKEIGKNVFIFD